MQGCYSNLESVRAGSIPTQLTVWKQLVESSTVCGWNEKQLKVEADGWVDYLRVGVPVLLTFIAPCTVCIHSQIMLMENTYSDEYNTELSWNRFNPLQPMKNVPTETLQLIIF